MVQTTPVTVMKVFLSLSLLVAVTLAEPPRYRQQYQSESNKYYFARQQQQQEAEIPAEAPYQASGWKPAGPSFELPQKQQAASPNQEYGTPAFDSQQQYGAPQAAPQNQYGAPTFPQQQYKASQRQSSAVASSQEQQYGAPQAAPQNQYGAPVVPQQQYRVPAAPQGQYAGYAAPQQQYGAPQAAPQQQYGEPQAAPRQQYGAPQATPQNQYGAPTFTQKFYGTPAAPQQSYGAPEMTTTQESTDFEDSTALPGGTESQAEPVDSINELNDEGEVDEQQRQSGQYFVALPDGRLQRVQYMSSQDIEAMKYFANIRAENVEPLRGPIYAYAPLQKLEFASTNLQVGTAEPYVAANPIVEIRDTAKVGEKSAKSATPVKLQQRQPLAAEVRYESPAAIVGLTGTPAAPVRSSYNAYPVPANEQRYFVTF